MRVVYLTHTDPARNMARFYIMSVQATLFAEWSLVREWGRIGRGGQVISTAYADEASAKAELERIQKAKVKRGYSLVE